ncbi:MAG: amino acid ABC transporter permease [Desulfobacula sp.]|nr:amino acid ABC transporter permease [Desulfobacula sp.]
MYKDTVIDKKLVHQPKFIGVFFGVWFVTFFVFDLGGSIFGQFLAPVIGDPATSGLYGRFVVAFVLGFFLTLNIFAIGFLPTQRQSLVVWIELAICFVGGFHIFNLSLEFIQSKIWFLISRGLFTTIYVSVISIIFAFIVAMIGAIAKLSGNGFAMGIANFYTSLLRALPLLLLLFLVYLGLPQTGYVIDAVPAGILALTLNYGAYMTEVFRGGIESIPPGQWEAARSLGFTFGPTMRRVILPQAIPIIIPPTGNMFISMLKDSSLVSVIGVWELMFMARTLGQKTFQHMEMLITVAMVYWVLTIVLEIFQRRLEKHYSTVKETKE